MAKDKKVISPAKDDSNSAYKSSKAGQDASTGQQAPGASKANSADSKPTNHDRDHPSWVGGSWRGKASAVAAVARESISASSSAEKSSTERPRSSATPRRPAGHLSGSVSFNTPSKSTPSKASMTKLNVTSGNVEESDEQPIDTHAEDKKASSSDQEPKDTANGNDPDQRPAPAAGWLGWWTRPKEESEGSQQRPGSSKADPNAEDKTKAQDREGALRALSGESPGTKPDSTQQDSSNADDSAKQTTTEQPQSSRGSWFGLWGSSAAPAEDSTSSTPALKGDSVQPSHSDVAAAPETVNPPASTMATQNPQQLSQRPASGSWAFWSREKPQDDTKSAQAIDTKREMGEIAVSGTDTQSNPKPAQITAESLDGPESASKKRERPVSSDMQQAAAKRKSLQDDKHSINSEVSSEAESSHMQESILRTSISKPKKNKTATATAKPENNLVLPHFNSTYHATPPSSYWSKITSILGRGQGDHYKHLSIAQSPHRPRRALAIGVHGYFPAAIMQKVLGPPTGTSIRFADGAAEAIGAWSRSHGWTCEIEKVALEGEGMIADRIDSLWKLLLNWIEQIRKADFVMVACHSQGVPVAVSLVARLLNFGCIQSHARLGICGMAGINLGPFASYQSRFLPPSANELFSFASPSSPVSSAYSSALENCLRNNVRVLLVGSIDDQLVSLESSTFTTTSHPYIYRAVFVDGRIHAPDFLTHLVGFALKLRNLGISDHGLIRELSGPLAGSLYTGEGHSRLYEDQAVYNLAVQHTLETETLEPHTNPTLAVKQSEAPSTNASNPYFLPWAMRGILEEEFVRKELKGETEELLGMFEKWKPQSKVLKDVKFRLEAVKSKL